MHRWTLPRYSPILRIQKRDGDNFSSLSLSLRLRFFLFLSSSFLYLGRRKKPHTPQCYCFGRTISFRNLCDPIVKEDLIVQDNRQVIGLYDSAKFICFDQGTFLWLSRLQRHYYLKNLTRNILYIYLYISFQLGKTILLSKWNIYLYEMLFQFK